MSLRTYLIKSLGGQPAAVPGKDDTPKDKSVAEDIIEWGMMAGKKGQSMKRVPAHVLKACVERSPPVRSCVEIIGRELTRSTKRYDRCWDFYPIDSTKEVGPDDPLRNEYKLLEALLLNPDRRNRRSFNQIVKAFVSDLLTYDDGFTSIAYGEDPADKEWFDKPCALYAQEASSMEIRHDEKGNIGDGTYFCDACEAHIEYTKADFERYKGQCPKHPDKRLKATAYVQIIDGTVVARWEEREMIHGHLFHSGARLTGTPLLLSLMLPIGNMLLMDEWYNDSYRNQRMPRDLVVFKGTTHNAVRALAKDIETQTALNPQAAAWIGLPEGKDVQLIKLLESPAEMQSLDWYKLYTEIIYRTYNVSPVVAGIIESGKAGQQPDMQRAVNANFIMALQSVVSEAFTNSALFEAFEIKSWYLGFVPIEEEDELMDAQTSQAWANAAATWRAAGYETALDEDGRPYPTGAMLPPPAPTPPGTFNGPSSSANVKEGEGIKEQAGPSPGKEPGNAFEANLKKSEGEGSPHYEQLIEMMLVKGAPNPRNLGRDQIAGLRAEELDFYNVMVSEYQGIMDQGIARLAGMEGASQAELELEVQKITAAMKSSLAKAARTAVERLYFVGMEAAAIDTGIAATWGGEETSAIDYLMSTWEGVNSVLPEFSAAQQAQFSDVIRASFAPGGVADWRGMVEQMKMISPAETWKLARIARSEATLIANQGRAAQYAKADKDGERLYDWLIAYDQNVCNLCAAVAAGNPYKLQELMQRTNNGRLHPNDRCTFVLRPLVGGPKR